MAVDPRKEHHDDDGDDDRDADEDDDKDDNDDDDDDFERPRAIRTANHTAPQGAERLRADPNPEPPHTTGGVETPSRPKSRGDQRTQIKTNIRVLSSIYLGLNLHTQALNHSVSA